MTKWLLPAFGLLSLLSETSSWAARDTAQYSSITVFGDSLVDAGNLYLFNGGTRPDPALGYFEHRFTNGYDYPDLLSLDLFGVPTTPSRLGGTNYAYGGARIVDTGDLIPDLAAQLADFRANGAGIDPNGLYIVNMGGNDVFGAKGVFGPVGAIGSFPDISSYLQAAANQYVDGIQSLIDLGARNILMTDFPLAGDPLTIEANIYFARALAGLELADDDSLFVYSLSQFNITALTNPGALGLPPLRGDTNCVAEGAQATGCAGIFSFDGVHPTAAAQEAGYRDMIQRFGLISVQPVPEPASWALMIGGFFLTGAMMRRHRWDRPDRSMLARV